MNKASDDLPAKVEKTRAEVAAQFLSGGCGIEVGASSRPFPVPPGIQVIYGDIHEAPTSDKNSPASAHPAKIRRIDAQTFTGIPSNKFDFVISAHVIEHLRDPIGAIVHAVRIIKPGGVYILVVPDLRRTFDQRRTGTSIEHLLADFRDGGEGTCRQAYEEHLRFVHPHLTGQEYLEEEIARQSAEAARQWRKCDIHFHAWTRSDFKKLLRVVAQVTPFKVELNVSIVNESIFVLRKRRSLMKRILIAARSKLFRLSLLSLKIKP